MPSLEEQTSMVSFTVRMEFNEPDREQVKECLRQLTAATRQEPGCVTYVAHLVKDAPTTILLYEQYRDQAALEQHRSSPHFKQYAADVLYKLMTSRSVEHLEAIA